MLQSKLFYKTTKEKSANTESVSHDLLVRAGFIDQLMAGVYTFLPLGLRVLKNIENIIRKGMEEIDGQEILMPVLQPKENWVKTDRINIDKEIIFLLKGNGDKEYILGPTHEEVVTPLAKKVVFSYRDLPLYVFQIQDKLRDELRAKSGILRTREFLMKDLYSFHSTQEDLDKYYEKVTKVYLNIFKECGIGKTTYQTLASGGSFSKYSDEFQTITNAGEDIIYICKKCNIAINKEIKVENPICPKCKNNEFEEKKTIEVGNIFKMGTRFSTPFNLKFTDRDGHDKPVIMGCYGIGLGRLMGAVVEVNNDERGIIWPKSIAPFLVHIISIEDNKKVKSVAEKIYNNLQKEKIEVLYDDRQVKSVGEKFAESDLIGIPFRIVISEKTLKTNSVEIKERVKDKVQLVKINQLFKYLKRTLRGASNIN
ncbi:MAG: aminoacyl--tRNA ligase-related protein [Patescibacteria group bacterium]